MKIQCYSCKLFFADMYCGKLRSLSKACDAGLMNQSTLYYIPLPNKGFSGLEIFTTIYFDQKAANPF